VTLRLADRGHPFTVDLAHVMSRLSMLETLEIHGRSWFPNYLPVVSALFAPDSLPSLRNVDIYCEQDLPPESNNHLYDLLAQRPTSHLLEVLNFGSDPPSEESARDLFIKMHTLCPNLRYPFGDFDDFSSLETMEVAQRITSNVEAVLALYDVEKVSRFFPHMRSIDMYGQTFHEPSPTRWDMFQALEKLLISSQTFVEFTHYPPMLRELRLSFRLAHGPRALPDVTMDLFVSTLCVQLPRLLSLKLWFGGKNFTKAHAERFLNSLRYLEVLRIQNHAYDSKFPANQKLEVAHGHLKSVPFISITEVETVLVWLPGVHSVTESAFNTFGVFSSNFSLLCLNENRTLAERNSMFERLATHCRITAVECRSNVSCSTILGISMLRSITSLDLELLGQPILDRGHLATATSTLATPCHQGYIWWETSIVRLVASPEAVQFAAFVRWRNKFGRDAFRR
jgi:hypothetical protein